MNTAMAAVDAHPVRLVVEDDLERNRLTVFFRLILAILALVLSYVFRIVNQLVAFLGWFYCLATGRMHRGMRDLSAWMLGYETQTYCYVGLLTDRYPSFAGGPTA